MSQKTKRQTKKHAQPTTSQRIEAAVSHLALGAMAVATVVSALHLAEKKEAKALPVWQPVYAFAGEQGGAGHTENFSQHQRMEEIRHPHASYGSTMRSHPTSGSV